MPELPEVEVTRQALLCVEGEAVTGIKVHQPKLRVEADEKAIHQLVGKTVLAVQRRGKWLVFRLDSQQYLLSRFGMTGLWRFCDSNEPVRKHDHIQIELEKSVLRYEDARCLNCCLLVGYGKPEEHQELKRLGLEPLEIPGILFVPILDSCRLWECIRNRRIAIKSAIMDQGVLSGVGNIYANESLFRAGIHPQRPANEVSREKLERLVQSIQQVLKNSIKEGGSTIKDFKNPNQKKGRFQHYHSVYNRTGEKCKRCSGTIEKATLRKGQQGTFFCNGCQR